MSRNGRATHRGALLLFIAVSIVSLAGFGCRNTGSAVDSDVEKLVVWGLWQESDDLSPIIQAYEDQVGVEVEYKKIASVANYEKMLLEALAEGRGPDIFVIHHTWVDSKRGIMSPAPAEVINQRQLQDEFVSVVQQDLVRDGFVYALPTSVDTLALYYNKDLLSAAGIANPPQTWQEFQRHVERLTQLSRLGIIEQSGAAFGTAENVNRAPDIVQMLMLQSGLSLYDPSSSRGGTYDINSDVGERALTFYTDFSNKTKKVYTWDLQQDYSLDAFATGKAAMMVNYSYQIPVVRAKNPRLSWGIAPIPQIADSTTNISFASYWPFAVSTASQSPRTAWNFVRFLTSAQAAQSVNQAQNVPPARRDSIDTLRTDPEMGVFAEQSLTAVSWPRYDIVKTDAIFNTMIDDVVTGAASIRDALRKAEDQVSLLGEGE